MKIHLTYIVLMLLSWLMIWGAISIGKERQKWAEFEWICEEHYQAKQRASKVVKENRALYREIARMKGRT